ncbi:hypothetical protein Bbelb_198070 [Branchiostoma belcheri]|nr:hypothetical protein Bbelb_198070 [Branchiostoma belcheri]
MWLLLATVKPVGSQSASGPLTWFSPSTERVYRGVAAGLHVSYLEPQVGVAFRGHASVTARHCDSQAAAIFVTFDLTGGPSIIKGEGSGQSEGAGREFEMSSCFDSPQMGLRNTSTPRHTPVACVRPVAAASFTGDDSISMPAERRWERYFGNSPPMDDLDDFEPSTDFNLPTPRKTTVSPVQDKTSSSSHSKTKHPKIQQAVAAKFGSDSVIDLTDGIDCKQAQKWKDTDTPGGDEAKTSAEDNDKQVDWTTDEVSSSQNDMFGSSQQDDSIAMMLDAVPSSPPVQTGTEQQKTAQAVSGRDSSCAVKQPEGQRSRGTAHAGFDLAAVSDYPLLYTEAKELASSQLHQGLHDLLCYRLSVMDRMCRVFDRLPLSVLTSLPVTDMTAITQCSSLSKDVAIYGRF